MESYQSYQSMKKRHQEEVNNFDFGFAFNKQQFEEMMEKWNLSENDTHQIICMGNGCFVLKKDIPAMKEMFEKQRQEQKSIKTLYNEMYIAFIAEMYNHECQISDSYEDVLETLNITKEDLKEDPKLLKQFEKAKKNFFQECIKNNWF